MAVRQAAAILFVGLWLGLLVASWFAATGSFRAVDRVLGPEARPELTRALSGVPAGERRLALRHLASEANRWMFRRFGLAQIVLGLLACAAAWPSASPARYVLAAALAVAAGQVALGLSIESFGRSLDFVARPLPAELGRRFGMLHGAFLLLDLGKAGLLLAAGHLLARRPF
jgi:hypothetical protein